MRVCLSYYNTNISDTGYKMHKFASRMHTSSHLCAIGEDILNAVLMN